MTNSSQETLIARDPVEQAALAAELIGRAIVAAVASRGVARVALSGGTTPSDTYRRVADFDLPWRQIEWFWVDERAVPASHERSNYRAALEALALDRAPGSDGRVHRMPADDPSPVAAARNYEAILRASFGVAAAVAFDVVTLGVGDDGHTASLFPGTGAVAVTDRLVLEVEPQPAKGLEARLTLSAPVLQQARSVLVLARGAAKRDVVLQARAPGPEDEIPARLLQRATGRVVWILDEPAAP